MDALEPDARRRWPPLTGLHEDIMARAEKSRLRRRRHGRLRRRAGSTSACAIRSRPDRFVLGIEFDGAGYAQAATARDRDRLRSEVLARLGWKLHRIGAPDWIVARKKNSRACAKPFPFRPGFANNDGSDFVSPPCFRKDRCMLGKDVAKLALQIRSGCHADVPGRSVRQGHDRPARSRAPTTSPGSSPTSARRETICSAINCPAPCYPEIPAAIAALGNERTGKVDPPGAICPKRSMSNAWPTAVGHHRRCGQARRQRSRQADHGLDGEIRADAWRLVDPDRQPHAHAWRPVHRCPPRPQQTRGDVMTAPPEFNVTGIDYAERGHLRYHGPIIDFHAHVMITRPGDSPTGPPTGTGPGASIAQAATDARRRLGVRRPSRRRRCARWTISNLCASASAINSSSTR